MLVHRISKKALFISAFFISTLCLNLFVPVQANKSIPNCQTKRFDQIVNVIKVYDGDTFKTDTGKKVRLIGINTPETGKKNKPAQPMANEAKRALIKLLATSKNKVGLRFDKDKHDRYKRQLAHAYLPNGINLQQQLLEKGLAAHIVVPPNMDKLDCYQQTEISARQQQRGMWSIPDYQYKDTKSLGSKNTGFQFVEGDVVHVGHSKKAIWLNLTGKTALRIGRDNLDYFNKTTLENIIGKRVQARGWLHYNKKRKELFMHVRHPASMVVLKNK
jgi:endonuclease YncB( thermonuclease family)